MARMVHTLFAVAVTACGGTPGAKPHDMSPAEHDRQAAAHADKAHAHAHQYDSKAEVVESTCVSPGVCWTSVRNPTEKHLHEADKHRRAAADHRAASAALREAEATACVGIPSDDRDASPFDHREDIASVAPLVEQRSIGKQSVTYTVGAIVTFRAVPGMTAEWLQRLVDCHTARNAALGHVVPEMPDCPLVPRGAIAHVRSVGNGFAVEIRADDAAVAREILDRAQRSRS